MRFDRRIPSRCVRGSCLVAALTMLLASEPFGASRAQTAPSPPVSAETIQEHLTAKGRTRGFTAPPAITGNEQNERTLIDKLRARATRGLSVEERTELAAVAKSKPQIDLEIFFDYDSADIASRAMPSLVELGKALRSGQLQGATFILSGHTDAKGSAAYNQGLSERRADAVGKFLAERFAIPAHQLIAVGYGKEQLKNTVDPAADENRRVQVVNLGK